MYNLLMAGREGHWDERDISTYEYDRFLSYTHEALRTLLLGLDEKSITEIVSLPALFAYEFPKRLPEDTKQHPPPARIGKILEIRRLQREVEFRFEFDAGIAPIPSARIYALARELDIDIGSQENYRTHWAIKDIDVLSVLRKEGLIITAEAAPNVDNLLQELTEGVSKPGKIRDKIFVVHGRDDGLKNEVGRWLSKIGFDDIILHEQANTGRTLITKFEEIAKDVSYAVVLMTPDDVGGLPGGNQAYRARQNVIFELGYFIGKLGCSRVAALVVGEVEQPSDYQGVVYIPYDKPGAWKQSLAREFKSLSLSFDFFAGI